MTENDLKQKDIDPPFWAFPWPGGQAIARYLLDNPLVIKDKYALDLASGSGIAGIAALLASLLAVESIFSEDFRDGSLDDFFISTVQY